MCSRISVTTILAALVVFAGVAQAKEANGMLWGQVVDATTGRPIAGALVIAGCTGNTATTGTDGAFSVKERMGRKSKSLYVNLTGLLTGSLFGGKTEKSVDPAPRELVISKPGYQIFAGEVPLIWAQAGRLRGAAERICLAPSGSPKQSGVAGSGACPDVARLGSKMELGLPSVISYPVGGKLQVAVTQNIPESLPLKYRAWLHLSTGQRIFLKYRDSNTSASTRTYTTEIHVEPQLDVMEIFVAMSLDSVLASSDALFGVGYSYRNTITSPEQEVLATVGELQEAPRRIVVAPGATAVQREAWSALVAALDSVFGGEDLFVNQEGNLAAVPDGPCRDYFAFVFSVSMGDAAVLDATPNDDQVMLQTRERALTLASRAMMTQQPDHAAEAIKAIGEAVNGLKEYGPGLRALGNAALALQEYELAAKCFTFAARRLGRADRNTVSRSSRDADLNFGQASDYGMTRASGHTVAGALGKYVRARGQNNAKAWRAAATALFGADLPAEAETAARNSLALQNEAATLELLGRALEAQGRLVEPMECYRQAVALEPNRAISRYALGLSLWLQDQRVEAATHLAKAASLAPKNGRYGSAAELAGMWVRAQQIPSVASEAAVALVLHDGDPLVDHMLVARALARQSQAVSRDAWASWVLGRTTDDADEALSHFTAARAAAPNEPLFAAECLIPLLRTGREKEAHDLSTTLVRAEAQSQSPVQFSKVLMRQVAQARDERLALIRGFAAAYPSGGR